jgi:hypothetical protein
MRKKKNSTARLSKGGILRIPKELLLVDGVTAFAVNFTLDPLELLLFPVVNGSYKGLRPLRKAMYSNHAARSPQVCVMSALRFMRVQMGKKPKDLPIKREKDGSLVVSF